MIRTRYGVAVLWLGAVLLQAQTAPAPATVKFEFERQGMLPPHWSVVVNADGSGRYDEMPVGEVSSDTTRQPIHVSDATLRRLNAGLAQAETKSCEAQIKNVANVGKKTVTYSGSSGEVVGQCTFNFTLDEKLKDAAEAFQAIAETMQEGARLKFKHRFDRLGLDQEMDILLGSIKQGRAIEVENIAPALQAIADDADVIQRVRVKAAELVKQTQQSSL